MEQVFRLFPRYEEYYEVDEGGVMRNIHTKELKKAHLDQDGYLVYNIASKTKRRDKMRVHRVVAFTWIPNPLNLPQVNHKDGNKLNNHRDNLEWVTQAENRAHAVKNGLHAHKLKQADIDFIKANFTRGNMDELANKYNVSRYTIYIFGTNRKGGGEKVYLGTTKKIIHIETGEIFNSADDLGKVIGKSRKYICRRLNGERPNNIPYRYL